MKDKTRNYHCIIIIILIMTFTAGCSSSKNLLIATFSQELGQYGTVYDILSGWVAYDELSDIQQNKMAAIGYKSGDIVPSVCIMRTGGSTGSIYLPKSSETDTENINLNDWTNIGKYKITPFGDLEGWANRNK